MSNKKITFSITDKQFHALEAIRYRNLASDKYYPFIPEFKELIQGMLLLTKIKVEENKNTLRSFINRLARNREWTEVTDVELSEEKAEQNEFREYSIKEEQILETSEKKSRTRSYIFSPEGDDLGNIVDIRNRISKYSKLSVTDLKDSEIVKESIDFIIRNKWRNIEFFHYTYFGCMFDLKPITILKTLDDERKNRFTEQEQIRMLAIKQDFDQIDKFIAKLDKTKLPKDLKSLYDFVHKGLTSNYAGFNYAEAFLGYWLTSRALPYNLTTFTFSNLITTISVFDKKEEEYSIERWEMSKELFISTLKELKEAIEPTLEIS